MRTKSKYLFSALLVFLTLPMVLWTRPFCAELSTAKERASPFTAGAARSDASDNGLDRVLATAHEKDTDRERELYRLCQKFEAEGSLSHMTPEEESEFLTYYISNYCIANTNSMSFTVRDLGNGTFLLSGADICDRRMENAELILKTFGTSKERSDVETIRATCRRVRRKMQFSYAYTYTDLARSVQDGFGVCEQYARVAFVLLNAEGIPTRQQIGYRDGSSSGHIWNECFADGAWRMVDFCVFANKTISPDGFVTASAARSYHRENFPIQGE